MRFIYKLLYLIGFTPWDTQETPVPSVLKDVIEGPQAIQPGRALDLGCGMGRHSIYMTKHGWHVTGVDSTGLAIRIARQRANKAGLDIDFRHGDVTRLEKIGLSGRFNFFLDGGCFHGMSDDERSRYSKSITQVAAPDAELLIFAFGPSIRSVPPRVVEQSDLERCFADSWNLTWSEVDRNVPDELKDSYTFTAWYRLKRR